MLVLEVALNPIGFRNKEKVFQKLNPCLSEACSTLLVVLMAKIAGWVYKTGHP